MNPIILVTGANGQLGNELKILSEKYAGWTFLFTDVDELDITSKQAISNFFKNNTISYVINCAAYTAVDRAETDRDLAMKINRDAVVLLAEEARRNKAKMLHVSTDYVFDGKHYRPYVETDETNPASAYGQTKLAGEKAIYPAEDILIVRTSWLYSEFGNNFVKTVLRLADTHPKLRIVADQIGTPTYAYNLAEALLNIVEQSENTNRFQHGIYHFSNEGVASWYDFAVAILKLSGINKTVEPITTDEFPTPAKRPYYSVLDKSKIKNHFGITIPHWEDALKQCLKNMKL